MRSAHDQSLALCLQRMESDGDGTEERSRRTLEQSGRTDDAPHQAEPEEQHEHRKRGSRPRQCLHVLAHRELPYEQYLASRLRPPSDC